MLTDMLVFSEFVVVRKLNLLYIVTVSPDHTS